MHQHSNVTRRRFLATASALGIAGFVGAGAQAPPAGTGDSAGGDALDLATVTCAEFAACLGCTFRISPADGAPIEVELYRARELRRASSERSEPRNPFALLFRGNDGTELAQGTHRVAHERLGEFSLFLVPVGMDGAPVFEAIFG